MLTLRELDEGEEKADEADAHGEPADGDVHLRLRLEREPTLAARRAALVLLPLAEGTVVDVAATLAHPELAVHLSERGVGLAARYVRSLYILPPPSFVSRNVRIRTVYAETRK